MTRWNSVVERSSKFDREFRGLSREQLGDKLPADLKKSTLQLFAHHKAKGWDEREVALFRKFGAVGGREALDETLERYGTGARAGYAMTLVLAGWMEKDLRAAMSALQEMMGQGRFGMIAMQWNGKEILSGFG